MKLRSLRFSLSLIFAALPAVIYGFSSGPLTKRTGVPVDGGLTCTQCHTGTPLNGGGGKLVIRASSYTPSVKQNIEVEISDPTAMRWGFQLTARLATDETKQAGTFTPSSGSIRVRCDPGADAPCNGALEFASHVQASTDAGTPNGKTFTVEWTPPPTDMGPVMFYAAGNAANNSGNPLGDHIYNTNLRVGVACTLTGTPSINPGGIANGADFRTTIAPNALISIFGAGFAAAGQKREATGSDLISGKIPDELACVGVEIAGKRVPVFYVQGDLIKAQALTTDNVGPVDVRVILNPGRPTQIRGAAAMVQMADYAPAFFTFNGKSIAAQNASNNNMVLADPSVAAGGVAAKPNDIVILYGTGFGLTDPVFLEGEYSIGLAPLRDKATVTIGGTTLPDADVLYAGLSPAFPGFYQFNVKVPASAPDGDVPVTIRVGAGSTQPGATIPVKR
ncbi:MAG: hypothetical protein HYR60_17220 [Acidobacteria bacterium]|nr:hypothetical protein [Acidobacteriota bacterium]